VFLLAMWAVGALVNELLSVDERVVGIVHLLQALCTAVGCWWLTSAPSGRQSWLAVRRAAARIGIVLSAVCVVDRIGMEHVGLPTGGLLSEDTAKAARGLLDMVAMLAVSIYLVAMATTIGARRVARAYRVAVGLLSVGVVFAGLALMAELDWIDMPARTRAQPGSSPPEAAIMVLYGVIIVFMAVVVLVKVALFSRLRTIRRELQGMPAVEM